MGLKRAAIALCVAALVCLAGSAQPVRVIAIDYPEPGSIFPPEITSPTFLYRDEAAAAAVWQIEVRFADGSPAIRTTSRGERMRLGPIDPDCVAPTNQPPRLTARQAATRTWIPDAATWERIKKHSVETPAEIVITGVSGTPRRTLSRGRVEIRTSKDPVGAPVFYRDVPLMPTQTEKGQIQPLASSALPLVAWRLRDIGQPASRLMMDDLPVCANCHSFSADGKTMGMDLDGLRNNKGLYTLTPVAKETEIREENVIEWQTSQGKLDPRIRAGFLSRVSPDGEYVVTTIDRPLPGQALSAAREPLSNYYVANYKDYRFLQVFFPTRGVIAWYSRKSGVLTPLAGADDPRYVQMNAVWSPGGEYLVFARAAAKEPNPPGAPEALFANDPNENQIRYDLYRIPFNGGRGGTAEPVEGASHNGMSNTFPKVSPDGRWIVFTQCRNGQLLRPDSQLFMVPADGGRARRMRANLPLMNSWHSFSPNSRWLVFSSKSRSPYTQMYLTHIDEEGNDSPAILVENTTAANRAVNLPEFVNVPAGEFGGIGGPVIDFFRMFNSALYLQKNGRMEESAARWKQVLDLRPGEPSVHNNLAVVLGAIGRREEAAVHFRKANELRLRAGIAGGGGSAAAHSRLGKLLLDSGRSGEAAAEFTRAVEMDPRSAAARTQLAAARQAQGRFEEADAQVREAIRLDARHAPAYSALGTLLNERGDTDGATLNWRTALDLDPNLPEAHLGLAESLYARGDQTGALAHWREAIRLRPGHPAAIVRAAWVLATSPDPSLRNGREAVALAVKAVQFLADDPAAWDTLAAAYAEAGRFQEAARTAQRAAVLASTGSDAQRTRAIERRIALYESGRAYRGPASAAGKP